MARRKGAAPQVPEILVVREDRSRTARRTGAGRPCGSDVLSVYLEGGPRYRLGRRTYRFAAPAAILIAAGTADDDLQEGCVRGIFALFRGRGLVSRSRGGPRDKTAVSLGADRMMVPQLKALAPADAERLAGVLAEIAELRGAGLGARLDRVGLLLRAIGLYCEAPGRGREGGGVSVHRGADRMRQVIDRFAFENIPMARLYERLELSAAHVETLFAAAFGMAPVAYRRRLRLRRARELLISSQLNVSEAAYAVGFTDPLYFSRVFRRRFGVTPSSLIRGFESRRR